MKTRVAINGFGAVETGLRALVEQSAMILKWFCNSPVQPKLWRICWSSIQRMANFPPICPVKTGWMSALAGSA